MSPRFAEGDAVNARYRIAHCLGEGGAGVAYFARDILYGGEVVVKVVQRAAHADEAIEREQRLLRGLVHPNLARMRDHGVLSDGRAYYVSDFIAGASLAQLARDVAPWDRIVVTLLGSLEALRFLHAARIRHGDFKPDNVLNRSATHSDGVLIDLSCAQEFGPAEVVRGTPGFIAPEVKRAETTDGAADVYAVGVTLERLAAAREVPNSVAKVAEACRHAVPAKRPTATEVIEMLGGTPMPSVVPYIAPTRLLGRDREVAAARRFLDDPDARIVCFHGAPGGGRTRMIEETKWLARHRHTVWECPTKTADGLIALLRLVLDKPELASDPSTALTVASFMRSLAKPTLIVLDDLDAADPSQTRLAHALLRVVDPPHKVAIATHTAAYATIASTHRDVVGVPVEPLEVESVSHWIAGRLPSERAADVHRLTGGLPGEITQVMRRLAAGDWSAEDLERVAEATARRSDRTATDRDAASLGHRVRVTLALCRLPVPIQQLLALGMPNSEIAAAAAHNDVVVGPRGMMLKRRTLAAGLQQTLSPRDRTSLRLSLAKWLDGGTVEEQAEAERLFALGGDIARAHHRLKTDQVRHHPDPWIGVAHAIGLQSDATPDQLATAASVLERAGRCADAIALVARGRRRNGDAGTLWPVASAAYLRTGKLERALHFAQRAYPRVHDEQRARVLDLLSRIHLKRAAWQDASDAAQEGLPLTRDPILIAKLHDDLGVAASYRGQTDDALRHLQAAAALFADGGLPRAEARSASYLGLIHFRSGDATAARRAYRRALELAERTGAADLIVYAAQNLAAACHQCGDLGEAAASYERGLALAALLEDPASEATLRCNVAKLYSDLGLFERAVDASVRAEKRARLTELQLIEGTAISVRGEVLFWQGELSAALAAFDAARAVFGEETTRELAETDLHIVRVALETDRTELVESAMASAQNHVTALGDVDDLHARLLLAEAIHLHQRQEPAAAVTKLDAALARAAQSGQRELEAECRARAARICDDQGARLSAEDHRRSARRLWEKTALSLSADRRKAFWKHPMRHGIHANQTPARAAAQDRTRQLERLLDINKKLNSSLDIEQILAWTIDSALDLTGAERGYVILAEGDELETVAARNIDPANAEDDARFSQGIARQVIRSGQPVIALDAEQDARFESQKSVHAMHLKSVIGVPIIAARGIVGVLYLDHRFRRGMFGDEQHSVLTAFADQVAIALTNARLHQELAERTAELDALTRGQAEQIDDLESKVRQQQRVLETRYDYGSLIGESAAMMEVFRTLDRVIGSDAPVLIQGESGTGKELIAKAIHFNGNRSAGPMVSINCGALPENLLEAELFGYRQGAFTGASSDRKGLLVAADGGTIFLDELGEMPPSMQVKLLRVLQEREVTPLGDHLPIPIDVRIVAATNRNLREEAMAGRFREDLYYRIAVLEVLVPPLRERHGDVPALVAHLLSRSAERMGRPAPTITKAAMRMLVQHRWPGNVRELENVVTKTLLLLDGKQITAKDLLLSAPVNTLPANRDEHHRAEAKRLLEALQATHWNISQTAKRLSVSRPTVYRWMRRHGFEGTS